MGAEVVVDHTGLYDGEALQLVDLQHPIHAVQCEDHATFDGIGAARQSSAGAAGDPRHARTTVWTSSVLLARTTATARPTGAHTAWSCERPATMSGSVTTRPGAAVA